MSTMSRRTRSGCGICISPYREEIERKAKKGRAVNIISWARERGVSISYNSLARHRENHMDPALAKSSAGARPALVPSRGRGSAGARPALAKSSAGARPALAKSSAGARPALVKSSAGASGAGGSDNGHKGKGEVVLIEKVAKKKRTAAKEDESSRVEANAQPVTDELLLNAVRDAVYGKLTEGKLELEINSAFKAIELKYKIAEQSQSEKLMLEILDEIRGQELGK